jgi:circadian clock protein KaiC
MNEPTSRRKVEPLEKAPTGIAGFDDIAGGGLPRSRTSLVVGGPGSGKTVFALQTLVSGARQWNEPGIFVAFEESSAHIVSNAASFGWDLPALEEERLFFLDARMPSDVFTAGSFDLGGLLSSLEAKAAQMGARRIVFDSVDVLLSILDDPLAARRELYRIHDWLARTRLTGLVTSRVDEDELSSAYQYGYLQYMADCVVLLAHHFTERVSLRTLRVVKYRGSAFAEDEAPFIIGPAGIEVASIGPLQLEYPVSGERISTGIERLDGMLAGGYYRGTNVLITGAPGTAKSTLCGAFIEAACERGERALYISFDEAASEVVRNLASVNISLEPYVESGLLRVLAARAQGASAEEHFLRLKTWIEEHKPRCVVIDPLSAMLKGGGELTALGVAQRLLYLTKGASITLVCTSLLEGHNAALEGSPIAISTIADTWIHLSYLSQGGERNRELTIVKSRGTGHSNQVRELRLSSQGAALSEVYTAGGEVLLGTLRWEKEAEEEREQERARIEFQRKLRELRLAEAEAQARMEILSRDLEARQAEIDLLQKEHELRQQGWEGWKREVRDLRTSDAQAPQEAPDEKTAG